MKFCERYKNKHIPTNHESLNNFNNNLEISKHLAKDAKMCFSPLVEVTQTLLGKNKFLLTDGRNDS